MYTEQELNMLFLNLKKKEKACHIACVNLNLLTDNGEALSIYKSIFHNHGLWKTIIEHAVQSAQDTLAALKPHINAELFTEFQAYFIEWEAPAEGKNFSTLQSKIQELKWLTSRYLEYLQSDFYSFEHMSFALEAHCQQDLQQHVLQKNTLLAQGLSEAAYQQQLQEKTSDTLLAQTITAPYKNASLTRAQQFEQAKSCFLKSKASFSFSSTSILSSCLYWMSQLLLTIQQKITPSTKKAEFSPHSWLQKHKTNLFHMENTLTALSEKESLRVALSKF